MKNSIKLFAAIIMITISTTSLIAQTQETTNAGAKILVAMTIVESKDMHFGTMTVPTAVDSVMLTVLGAVSPVGVAVTLLAQTPTSHAAAYDVTGDPLATYEIILPDNVTVTVVSGSDHMHVVNFLSSKALNTSALDGSGDDNFTVGATLALINAQPAGTYTGTFNVSVAYN